MDQTVWMVLWKRSGRLYGLYANEETAELVADEVRKTMHNVDDTPVVEEWPVGPAR